jgi:hypothetical protein
MSRTHLRGNTVEYSWNEHYGDGEERFLDLTGYRELCQAMQTRTAEDVADTRFNIARNGQTLHYTHDELMTLLIDAEGNTRV